MIPDEQKAIDCATAPIRAELLAKRIQAAHEVTDVEFRDQLARIPDLPRLLWFAQWYSFQPGGLSALVAAMIEACPDSFDTPTSVACGQRDRFTPREAFAIAKEIACDWHFRIPIPFAVSKRIQRAEFEDVELSGDVPEAIDVASRIGTKGVREICREAALRHLPEILRDLCESPKMAFPEAPTSAKRSKAFWFLDDLLKVLRATMEAHSKRVATSIVPTKIVGMVFDELDFAAMQRRAVSIMGNSRLGKTVAVSGWCRMNPGRGRLVTVPDGQRERDFLAAHADAFGISHDPRSSNRILRNVVAYVVKWSRLTLVYDEAHFLIPTRYSRGTPPSRLNWIRCQVIDRGVGCAFFSTPQSYNGALQRYVQQTRYTFEQWVGRVGASLTLPEDLPNEDLVAVARRLCPTLSDRLVSLLASCAAFSDGYVATLEDLAERLRFYAGRGGRSIPSEDDVDAAVLRVMGKPIKSILQEAARKLSAEEAAEAQPLVIRPGRAAAGRRQVSGSHAAVELPPPVRAPAVALVPG
jgi:DNA transposition AAA+ family ATPase